ncbi:PTS sugar transporter subunit IIA [Priestia filamentosa]|uniref:PTS glucose transporter subunit IIA n=1 Tax=Priestia filamentosa TaxID=1402861 RepID=A0A1X7EDX1_9BACI|nr:PTS glucose transporter subunit IIA [Priestia filamentosa]AKO92833.1 PTS glucose transporter subunit IIA [Priestia filamentosa]MDT3762876.1 PTS glucose transporter subunit IIA [Priestia filamentosa]OXS69406.1 PTS glucose transporter subunit IIA [Priestia filamentosa]RJS63881.1 PTS glucose transporter subunit IIA [Priestia filamentosa]WCM13971.1 PTS glucose transporter subunit IIA [Priestia filamentosa]
MFKNLFQKKVKTQTEEIYSPLNGEVISLAEVPDPVFSNKMMGDGIAIIPKEGKLVSPVEGKIVQVFPTKHAIGIKSVNGVEILIHVGLETVDLRGEGFETFVEEGQSVKVGDVLSTFDIHFLESKNKEIVTPIIITNTLEKLDNMDQVSTSEVSRQELLLKCNLK